MNQYTRLLESSHYQNNESPNNFSNLALMDGHFVTPKLGGYAARV